MDQKSSREDLADKRAQAVHPARRRDVHHEPAEGRSASRTMANRNRDAVARRRARWRHHDAENRDDEALHRHEPQAAQKPRRKATKK